MSPRIDRLIVTICSAYVLCNRTREGVKGHSRGTPVVPAKLLHIDRPSKAGVSEKVKIAKDVDFFELPVIDSG